jgi:hypothetical protein
MFRLDVPDQGAWEGKRDRVVGLGPRTLEIILTLSMYIFRLGWPCFLLQSFEDVFSTSIFSQKSKHQFLFYFPTSVSIPFVRMNTILTPLSACRIIIIKTYMSLLNTFQQLAKVHNFWLYRTEWVNLSRLSELVNSVVSFLSLPKIEKLRCALKSLSFRGILQGFILNINTHYVFF